MSDERKARSVRILSSFDARLTDIGRYWNRKDHPQAFERLVDALQEHTLPLLRRFPAIGRRVLNTKPDTIQTLLAYEKIVEASERMNEAPELREYIFDDYILLYLLTNATIFLVSIRHSREVSFDFTRLWGAER